MDILTDNNALLIIVWTLGMFGLSLVIGLKARDVALERIDRQINRD